MASGEVARARATWVWRGLEKAVHLTVAGQQGATFSADALTTLYAALTASRDPNYALLIGNVSRVPMVVGVHMHVDERHSRPRLLLPRAPPWWRSSTRLGWGSPRRFT